MRSGPTVGYSKARAVASERQGLSVLPVKCVASRQCRGIKRTQEGGLSRRLILPPSPLPSHYPPPPHFTTSISHPPPQIIRHNSVLHLLSLEQLLRRGMTGPTTTCTVPIPFKLPFRGGRWQDELVWCCADVGSTYHSSRCRLSDLSVIDGRGDIASPLHFVVGLKLSPKV